MASFAVGMVGLGVMGRNLALNMEEKGFPVAGYDAWPEPVARFSAETAGKRAAAFDALGEFVASLERPRRVVLLVKAGDVVDRTVEALIPFLEEGDLVVDAGNEHFARTERRARELDARGVRFFGMGVSGGERGARLGPSLMPGGDRQAYEALAPLLKKIAAQHPDGPCVTYCGPGGAGHYVKMVHNGIEYGDMQLIAEAYDVLRVLGGMSNPELADTFAAYNEGELKSFLVEITADIFRQPDDLGEGALVDKILDVAGMKGTGKWTVQDASELGVPIPTIAASVEARMLSAGKDQRVTASGLLPGPRPSGPAAPVSGLARLIEGALYCAKVASYAQGMSLLRAASDARNWGIRLGELARIWQDGCIIRAKLLGSIKKAYSADEALPNLLFDPDFRAAFTGREGALREVVSLAARSGLPLPGMSASLAYYDALRRPRLPANLIQAQRDYFGAHTFRRVDRPGDFHAEWGKR